MKKFEISNRLLSLVMAFAAMGLLSGLYAGLVRLGFFYDAGIDLSGALHGPLMINAFLGTLISLERAAAIEKRWTLSGPFLMAASVVFMLFIDLKFGAWLFLAGSIALTITLLFICNLQPKIYHFIMAGGGLSLVIGNLLFLNGFAVSELVFWWMGFPLLTIFGERLELNRIMRPPKKAQWAFVVFILLWILGTVFMHYSRDHGFDLVMIATILIAFWLVKYDIARKTIKLIQWTQYSAWCLLSGYIWLILTGIFGLWSGLPAAGPVYDALLHMVFVGFVFSMIFAHASVIIPSLSGMMVPWSQYFYLPLFLLHVSLILRIYGDFTAAIYLRNTGSWLNVAAILLFLMGILFQLIKNRNR